MKHRKVCMCEKRGAIPEFITRVLYDGNKQFRVYSYIASQTNLYLARKSTRKLNLWTFITIVSDDQTIWW